MTGPRKTKVLVYRISYFEQTKKIWDIVFVPTKDLPYTARDYHDRYSKTGLRTYNYGVCGSGFATVGGGGREHDISHYREI